jgi:hypothetical protein
MSGSLNPKALSPYVTNLEMWSLMAAGFAFGRWGDDYFGTPLALAAIFGAPLVIYWWRGHCGLDQWPTPHGRYYKRWLATRGAGDYYPWLAKELGNRPPWTEWARQEKRNR